MNASSRSVNSSTMGLCTSTRVPAKQIWPEFEKTPIAAPGTALSRSASAQMMSADLPPSSSCSFLMLTVDASMMRRPVSVDPVNATRSTSGCAASAFPAALPEPVTTLMTPAGTPASCRISATRSTDSEASEAGLSTAVHPLARTAPIIQNCPLSGPFQGMIPPMTPTGAFSVIVATLPGMPFIRVSPEMLVAWEAKNDSIFIKEALEFRNLETGAPMSRASIWMSSSNLWSRTWAMRVSNAWRS